MNPREKKGEDVRGGPPRVLFVDFATHFGGAVLALADLLKGLPGDPTFTPFVLAYQKRAYTDALFPGIDHSTGKMWLSHVTRHRVRQWATRRLRANALVYVAMRLYTLADYVQELLVTLRIYREILRNRIDVLHLNNGPSRMGIRAARWARVPVVAHLRGHGGSKEVTTPLERRMASSASVVAAIAVSRSVAESYVEHGMPRNKIVVIHDPVHLDDFDEAASRRDSIRSSWGLPPDAVVAGAFGRVMRYKGQEEFMMAAVPLFEDHPELRLLIVGDSSDAPDQGYFAHLQELAGREPFKDRVVFTGYQHDVAGLFCACDLVVHSARIREGFGRVVTEGMAAGRPVIAMDDAGPRDIITHEVDGLLVPPRDVGALSEAMGRLLASPALRERLGRNGRRTVEHRFTVPVIGAQMAAFYQSLPPTRPRRRP